MDTQTRHALKQDPLVQATASGANWLQDNREKAIRLTLIALAVVIVVAVAAVVYNVRSTSAQNAFGSAMDTFNTPIAVASQPAPPGTKTFASAAERAKAANPLFLDVANRYGMTTAGHNALYFTGLTYEDMDQPGQAETYLKKAASAASAMAIGRSVVRRPARRAARARLPVRAMAASAAVARPRPGTPR